MVKKLAQQIISNFFNIKNHLKKNLNGIESLSKAFFPYNEK